MKPYRAVFQIIEDNNCPLYTADDVFTLTEKAISFSEGQVCCLILVREMTELLFQFLAEERSKSSPDLSVKYSCSGCAGLIKFVRTSEKNIAVENHTDEPPTLTEKQQRLFNRIADYPLLKAIPTHYLKKFIGCFKVMAVKKGSSLIKKGHPNQYLFMLLSGNVLVEDGAVPIARLGEGEVCGEMSYFGNNIATTSVRTMEDSLILAISGEDFGKLIKLSDSVHSYMARLLAKRLTNANSVRTGDFDFSMQGRINEMAPVELLQIFHMHQKTGVLSLELPHGPGRVCFLEGAIVGADYDSKSGQDAVFSILAEKEGVYSFTKGLPSEAMKESAIGEFMMLLMEGVRRADEE